MENKYQKGFADSKPYYIVDKESGKLIPVYFPADAVMPEARPGAKAGNPLLDEINEKLRGENITEKMKRLYKKSCTPGKE